MLTGPRGFYRGVEREDVGLKGNAVNHPNDVGNFPGRGVDGLHGLHHLRHHGPAFDGYLGGGLGQFVGVFTGFVVLFDRGGQLFHGGRRLLQCTGLFFSARRQVQVARRNLAGGGGHGVSTATHLQHDAHQAVIHVLQCLQQLSAFILGVHAKLGAQVATRHGARNVHCLADGARDGAGDPPGEPRPRDHTQGAQQEHQRAGGVDLCPNSIAAVDHDFLLQGGQGVDGRLQRVQCGQGLCVHGAQGLVFLALVQQARHFGKGDHVLGARLFQANHERLALGQVNQFIKRCNGGGDGLLVGLNGVFGLLELLCIGGNQQLHDAPPVGPRGGIDGVGRLGLDPVFFNDLAVDFAHLREAHQRHHHHEGHGGNHQPESQGQSGANIEVFD